ncbi:cellulose binding domain-containing protein [Solwaraspora sp. WMMD791]|uniref:cellulose binding domain-containing protein n=1 Tax=Solwaraspora sp. WMMD791 TaxID=3016086 RepID=UPI00249CEDC0|nr:cellulose binding domain-containing protein [Solwaraspora sp. WMMD791]WFE25300.1 cellulose binding domain-containing protein [Solwaraspora sp. WMMD791]
MSLSFTPPTHPRTDEVPRSSRRTSWWRAAAGVAAAVVLAASGTAATSAPAHATGTTADATSSAGCLTVTIESSYWNNGPDSGGVFRDITITNNCATAVTGWKLVLTLPAGETVQQGWNANWTLEGKTLTATPTTWNNVIAAGRSVEIGYVGAWTGGRPQDPGCTINGDPCDGTGPEPAPEVTLTSPLDGSYVAGLCAVRMTADATTNVGTIDRVEFYINDILVGSDSSAPYGIDVPPDHPALRTGSPTVPRHTAYARVVTVAPAATADSPKVGFTPAPIPPALMVVACPSQVQVPAGGTTTMVFTLAACTATAGLTLTVTGDPRITVSPLVLPAGTRERQVTVTAAVGSEGATARITATADTSCLPGSAQVTVVPAV